MRKQENVELQGLEENERKAAEQKERMGISKEIEMIKNQIKGAKTEVGVIAENVKSLTKNKVYLRNYEMTHLFIVEQNLEDIEETLEEIERGLKIHGDKKDE